MKEVRRTAKNSIQLDAEVDWLRMLPDAAGARHPERDGSSERAGGNWLAADHLLSALSADRGRVRGLRSTQARQMQPMSSVCGKQRKNHREPRQKASSSSRRAAQPDCGFGKSRPMASHGMHCPTGAARTLLRVIDKSPETALLLQTRSRESDAALRELVHRRQAQPQSAIWELGAVCPGAKPTRQGFAAACSLTLRGQPNPVSRCRAIQGRDRGQETTRLIDWHCALNRPSPASPDARPAARWSVRKCLDSRSGFSPRCAPGTSRRRHGRRPLGMGHCLALHRCDSRPSGQDSVPEMGRAGGINGIGRG